MPKKKPVNTREMEKGLGARRDDLSVYLGLSPIHSVFIKRLAQSETDLRGAKGGDCFDVPVISLHGNLLRGPKAGCQLPAHVPHTCQKTPQLQLVQDVTLRKVKTCRNYSRCRMLRLEKSKHAVTTGRTGCYTWTGKNIL